MNWPLVVFLVVVLLDLLAIAVCDALWQVVPAVLIWPGILIAFTFRLAWGIVFADWEYIIAGVALAAITAAPTLLVGEEKAGLGDAQVYTLVGLFLGYGVIAVLFLASISAAVYGMARKRTVVPVVPFIAGATVVVLAVGMLVR